MLEFKRLLAYYQGTEESTPGKKKYRSDPKLLDQPRFKTPFFRNYDYISGDENGPGGGYQELMNHNSISEFLAAKRKRNKDNYKAEDYLELDDGSKVKLPQEGDEKKKKMAERQVILKKLAMDFPTDDQITPILGDDSSASHAAQIGSNKDQALPQNDLEGKTPDELNFGRDYGFEDPRMTRIDRLLNQYLKPKEPGLLGLKNFPEEEDLDTNETKSNLGQDFGNTDSGNTSYTNNSDNGQ